MLRCPAGWGQPRRDTPLAAEASRASRKAALRPEREALRARVAQLDEVLARTAHLSTAG